MKRILYGFILFIIIGTVKFIHNSNLFDNHNSKEITAGEQIFNKQCLNCHGETGKGEGKRDGTAINNQHYLNTVTKEDIYNSIKFGRDGTGMPAYGPRLSEEEMNQVVAFIRNWKTDEIRFEVPETISGDAGNGEKLYNLYCLSCHGEAGEGKLKMGTALSNVQFLKYTTNKQIWIGTAYGREETRMGPSLKGLDGARQLKEEEITDIITYIRSLEE